jgi:EAL domain-containing protein (putative c-di-GMP-specific phosphodiesterase class I)
VDHVLSKPPKLREALARSLDQRGAERTDRMLVDSVITLARRLGLRTVAEGIETAEQLEILQQLGCELGQGYLFATPMLAKQWLQWMERPRQTQVPSASVDKAALR